MKNFILKWNESKDAVSGDFVYTAPTPLSPTGYRIVAETDKNKFTGEIETYFYAIELYGFSKPFSTLHEAQDKVQEFHDKNWQKWLEKWDLI